MLQAAFDEDRVLGGKNVLLCGDFCQIEGQSGSLATKLVQHSAPYLSRKCSEHETYATGIFNLFQRFELSINERAKLDSYLASQLQRFHLRNDRPPMTMEFINNIQIFQSNLYEKDPGWYNKVIAVQSNMERYILTPVFIKEFALRNKRPIFRWYCRCKEGGNIEPNIVYPRIAAEYVNAGAYELECYFCKGMPVVMNSRVGHRSWKIVNGRGGARSKGK